MNSTDAAGICNAAQRRELLRLRYRLLRHVTLRETKVTCAGQSFPWFEVVDGDTLLERAAQAAASEADPPLDPYWAATWRSAVGLSRYLESLDLAGERVLELGCGSGRVGLAAAALGATVTMTDGVSLALCLARLNTWPVRRQVRVRLLRWGQQRLSDQPPFPWIVGSDVVYDQRMFERLERCVRQHLAPNGRLLITEPGRHTGDQFQVWMCRRGWRLSTQYIALNDGHPPIRLFDARLQ